MSSEETTSPDSIPAGTLPAGFSSKVKGGNSVDLNDFHEETPAPADGLAEAPRHSDRKSSLEKDGGVIGSGGKGISGSGQLTSKIRRMFKADSSYDPQSRQSQLVSSQPQYPAASAFRPLNDERSAVPKTYQSAHPDGNITPGARRHSKDGQLDRDATSSDTRWKAKFNLENQLPWQSFSSVPPEHGSLRSSQSGYSDEEGRGERSSARREGEQKGRERSKSQPSAFSGSAHHPLYRAHDEVNPLYRLRYQEDMEH